MSRGRTDEVFGARARLARAIGSLVETEWSVGADVELQPPRDTSFGDLSTQVALSIARKVGRPPREIATRIVEALETAFPDVIASLSVDGPGFINCTLTHEYLEDCLFLLAREGLSGCIPDSGLGRRAMVEFVSTNPTGPLTVGHCRQAVLGDTISSLLEATGWVVDREYYYNDSGKQIDRLGNSLAARYSELPESSVSGTEPPEDGYRGEYIADWAGELLERHGRELAWPGDRELFISFALRRAMAMIEEDLELLGVEFDRYFRETELIPDATEQTIERMMKRETPDGPLVYEDQSEAGKLWLRLTALGRPEDRVIRRSDGRYTYRLPDIAYHVGKFERGYELLVDVFGADHLDTSRDVVAAVKALLGEDEVELALKVIIHQFVTLLEGGRKVRMSTRAANYVTLRELVEQVGSVDVTRYLFLTRRSEAHMDFDLDLARTQSEENPVYYVQYAHARISGILRNASEEGLALPVEPSSIRGLLGHPRERELMRLLQELPWQVTSAAAALEPHRLTELMAEVASAFHGFYHSVRVIQADSTDIASARLLLAKATGLALRDLLSIVGVEAPERM